MENNIKNYEALVEATTTGSLQYVKEKIKNTEFELREIYENLERSYDKKRFFLNFNIKEVYTNRLKTFKEELSEYLADTNNPDISSVTCKTRNDSSLTLTLNLNAFKNIPSQKFISNSKLIFNLSVSSLNTLKEAVELASTEIKTYGYPNSTAQCILPLHLDCIKFYFSDGSGFTIADETKLQSIFSDDEVTTVFFYNPASILAGSSIVNLIKQTIGLLQLTDFIKLGYKNELTDMMSDSVSEGTKIIPSYVNMLQAISIKNSDAMQNDSNLAQSVNPEEALARHNVVHMAQVKELNNRFGQDALDDIEDIFTDEDEELLSEITDGNEIHINLEELL